MEVLFGSVASGGSRRRLVVVGRNVIRSKELGRFRGVGFVECGRVAHVAPMTDDGLFRRNENAGYAGTTSGAVRSSRVG